MGMVRVEAESLLYEVLVLITYIYYKRNTHPLSRKKKSEEMNRIRGI